MEDNEYIYIVLIKALTGLGKLMRKINKYEYTHIAVSFSDKLEDFVTFSRKKHYSPFNAGLMHEKKEHYAFGKNESVKVKVYKLPVSKLNIKIIKEYVNKIENDDEYIFNLYSMITMPVFHGIRIYKAHNCMSFTSKVIELSNCINLERPYYKYSIKEIDKLLEKYLLQECYIEKSQEDNEYMSKVGTICNLKMFFKLNGQLIYRLLFKMHNSYE